MRKALLAILSSGLLAALTAAEPLPADAYMAAPQVRTLKLSPDGRSYGFVEVADGMEYITVVDLTTSAPRRAAAFKDLKVANYWWKSSGVILVLVESLAGNRDWRAFDVKTGESFFLYHFNTFGSELLNPLVDDPDHVLISLFSGDEPDLRRVNIRTGKAIIVQPSVGRIFRWLTNRAGNPVAGFGVEEKRWFMTFPVGTGKPWRRVQLGEKNTPDFLPISVAADQKRILCIDYTAPETRPIVIWDPANDTKETLWQAPGIDLEQLLCWGDDFTYTRGILYETDRPRVRYLAPTDEALAKSLDAALPTTFNSIVSTSADESKMIIQSFSDVVPDWYYLLDRKTGRMAQLGSAYPKIDPAQSSPTRYFTFKARDGLELHGRIYLPKGNSAPSPAMLVVADFTQRSRFEFNLYFQFLAGRGYAAVEIDHRGTAGYGRTIHEAGTLQISGAIADDLADGMRWLIAEGLVDRSRIGIQGIGYGGLIAVPALQRYPELFRVWANFATPMTATDLNFNDVVFGRFTEKELEARIGGYKAGRKYIASLDLVPLMSKIQVPSFHFYSQGQLDQEGAAYATTIPRLLKSITQPHVLVKGRVVRTLADFYETRDERNRGDSARAFTELAAFLDQYLAAPK
jgi:dipeptidyl aminopeptidase/acylaminoacyl peptidase